MPWSGVKEIPLSQGKVALVDAEDFERLSQYKWHYSKRGYAARGHYWKEEGKRKHTCITMHREIMGNPLGLDVDHKDGNKLDNQKANLRVCSKKENGKNIGGWSKNKSSRYKGVRWRKDTEKWSAQIMVERKSICLGSFDKEEDAALEYNFAAHQHFGKFARLNIMGGG